MTKVHATLGQLVRQGETITELNSQELSVAQLSLLKAVAEEQLQKRAVERAEVLLESDVIGADELQRRQNELAVARAERRAAAN